MKYKVLITSGGTKEHIDDVRVLTNISTGKLGARIAEYFIYNDHEVTYVSTRESQKPFNRELFYNYLEVTNVDSVMKSMEELVPKHQIIIHPMAVSDFTFDYEGNVKCSGSSIEDFINHIRNTIKINPKVISNFRNWNNDAVIVGFKFTSGQTKDDMISIAKDLLYNNKLDMVFANDLKQIKEANSHCGVLIMDEGMIELKNKEEIGEQIFNNSIRIANNRKFSC
jgi:phosphopantothenate-cysteine ligase